jgi:hypothetical protein
VTGATDGCVFEAELGMMNRVLHPLLWLVAVDWSCLTIIR